jgi:putative heme iron utilization protein
MPNPIRKTDGAARKLAQDLTNGARYAALGTFHPLNGHPHVTRIAIVWLPGTGLLSLISDLSLHSRALRSDQRCSLLLGAPGPKGDPLTHPRLTLTCRAEFLEPTEAERAKLKQQYLVKQPKSKLFADFADFNFVRFRRLGGALNGGFGKAYELAPSEFGEL